MTDKEKVIKKLKEALDSLDITSDLRLVLIQTIEYLQEEPVSEDFENALAEEWKGYNDRGAAKVDALEDNTQELAFAKGFYRGWHYNKEKSVSEDLPHIRNRDTLDEFAYQCAYDLSNDWAKETPTWHDVEMACKFGAKWQKAKDESTTEDLGEYINELSKQFQEVSFAKLSRIAVRVAKWQKEQFKKDCTDLCNGIATAKGIAVAMAYDKGVADTKVQMMKNIWKPADGDDLPEIDREVIALLNNGKVVFAHRPDPKGWDAKSIITEKVEHYTPDTYGKGGWNIPNVKWWLDVDKLPNMEG